MSKALQSSKQSPDNADRDAHAMAEPGALTAALNWYRAMPVSDVHSTSTKIGVPTLYVWSDGNTAVLSKGARNCGRYANGEYRFETLHGVPLDTRRTARCHRRLAARVVCCPSH